MNYGGPVWHCSAAPCGRKIGKVELLRIARRYLAGVGDMAHEFHEWTGYAFHVRRRLNADEIATIGDAVDCRGTEEGQRRLDAVKDVLPAEALQMAALELRDKR